VGHLPNQVLQDHVLWLTNHQVVAKTTLASEVAKTHYVYFRIATKLAKVHQCVL